MINTLTPKKIALRAGLFSSLIVSLLGAGLIFFFVDGTQQLYFLPAPFLIFGITFWVVYWLMEKYIDQNIKQIYRSIHSEKVDHPLSSMKVNMDVDVFKEVNTDVEHWAQDSRKEIEQLKDQVKFRRQFVGNLSHELKTPLTIIQGNILTLLEGAVEDKKIRDRFLIKAAENVERLEVLIADLDSISNLESGRDDIIKEKFDLVVLVNEVLENLKGVAKKNKISLEVIARQTQEIWVNADKHKIDQVITNLIVNSIKYGKPDGVTGVSFVELGDNIQVEIKDNGMGIAPKHLPRLFERFYRVDKSRARHIGGTGLGLAIVKHIIDAHKQTISVRSTPEEGSVFSFTLEKG